MSIAVRQCPDLAFVRYSAVLVGLDKRRDHDLIEHELLDSPQEALRWLDDRLARYEIEHPVPRDRRIALRDLRGDLRRREEWLLGNAHCPYAVAAETHSVKLEGRLCPVRTLPLLDSCLLLETS